MIYKNDDGIVIDNSKAYDIDVLNTVISTANNSVYSCEIYKFFYAALNKEFKKTHKNVRLTKTAIVPHFNNEKLFKCYFEVKYKKDIVGKYEFTAPYDFRFLDYSDFTTMFILQQCYLKRPHFLPHMTCNNEQELQNAWIIIPKTIYANNEQAIQEQKLI